MEEECVLKSILNGVKEPTDLPLELLKDITNDFSDERIIGHGGFAVVYKGVKWINGNIVLYAVAVKRIHTNINTIDDKSFRAEITSLMKIRHQNIVRFLGFSSITHREWHRHPEADEMNLVNVNERLLCLEYARNGSLDKHITDELRGLEWETRYEIITGISKGLYYLHGEKIVHMDLKPANILIDDRMVPKITDFGLSRPNNNTHTTALPIGTSGYIAPEYRDKSKTTPACDVFSLGAIIMELVTGGINIPNKHNVLRRWRHRWNKPPTPQQYQQVTGCIDIAVRCREHEPKNRPSIVEIISTLSKRESTDIQESMYLDDDMLGIDPLELHYTFVPNKQMSWTVKLSNETRAWFAFNIEGPSKQYTIQPNKGTVPPQCKEYFVQITLKPQERAPQVTQKADKFIVQSTKVNEDRVTPHTFCAEADEVVDEVDFMVVYKAVEAVSSKAIVSSSYEDGARRQLDRRNFHPPVNFSNGATNMTYLVRDSDRAIDVIRGAMGSLLHKLGGLLKEEFNLETSVKEDIHLLSEELVKMQQVLRKVSDVQHANLDDLVKLWAINVREMSYNVEDFIDGFLVHCEPDSNGSGFRELTHEMCFLLDKGKTHQSISDLIREHLSKQVQVVAEQYKEYKVDHIVANATTKADIKDPRNSGRFRDREDLVGIKKPTNELISLFEKGWSNSKLKIVSVVGLGGLGKTTLAKAVFEETKTRYTKAFVPMGQKPNVMTVLKKLIRKFQPNCNIENLEMDELVEKLQEYLKDKRYFIVIDDIWESESWNSIRPAFPDNRNRSRVMITTRNHYVANNCCSSDGKYVYEMKPLSKADSKSLFLRRIFGSKEVCPDALKDISDDILKRCGGMPLAINSIASLLAGKPGSSWKIVWKSLGALTQGKLERETDIDTMKQVLDLSYTYLPDDLKTCMIYVCMYPKDREIDKKDLLRQWVAEGFISRNDRLDAEDIAENNFKELINMSMIQPGEIDYYNNEVVSCRVHDIILDLIRSKSREEKFIHVIDGLEDVSGQIRRVSVQHDDKEDNSILAKINIGSLEHVRSVVLYRCLLLPNFMKHKYVRVLYLEEKEVSIEHIDLTGISSLSFLRYLKIACYEWSNCELMLPDHIGQLQQLETIDLEGCELKNYPSDIITLPWLSHLRFSSRSEDIMLPEGIECLKSLRTLVGVCLTQSSLESIRGLGELTNLRNLELCAIWYKKSDEEIDVRMNALHSSISRLSTSLRILSLEARLSRRHDVSRWSGTLFPEGSDIRKLHLSGFSFQRCPEWIGKLDHLYSLSIEVREVASGISIVKGLPSLAYLEFSTSLREETEQESVVISGSGAFKALKHLTFYCAKATLTFEKGALPKLEILSILFLVQKLDRSFLSSIGIQHLPTPTLKQIYLRVTEPTPTHKQIYLRVKEPAGDRYPEVKHLSETSFRKHHPGADIYVRFQLADKYAEIRHDMDDQGGYDRVLNLRNPTYVDVFWSTFAQLLDPSPTRTPTSSSY